MNIREKVYKDTNNLRNAPLLKSLEIKQKQIDVVREALKLGLSINAIREMAKEKYPEIYTHKIMIERLVRVWNTRQIDEEIIEHIESVIEDFKNS